MRGVVIQALFCLAAVVVSYGDGSQQRHQHHVPDPNQYFMIKNKVTGKCVDVSGSPGTRDRANIQTWDCEFHRSDTDQVWSRDQYGRLRNRHGKCMDVSGYRSKKLRANVQLYTCEDPSSSRTDQIWDFIWDPDQRYIQIVNRYTNRCLDASGYAVNGNGINLQQFACEQDFNIDKDQWWELVPV